jgi:hypothetical protein
MHYTTSPFLKHETPFVTQYGTRFWGENMTTTNSAREKENLVGSGSNSSDSVEGGREGAQRKHD